MTGASAELSTRVQWLTFPRPAGAGQRNGRDLQDLLTAAVKAYYGRTRRLPRAVVAQPRLDGVHPSLVAETQLACRALELKTPVKPLGGCLASEVWLEVG